MIEQAIWNPQTGITDLGIAPEELSDSRMPGVRAVWTQQQERLKGSAQLSDFTEKMSREWAIETGIIENLYDIDRGVTQTLIENGFRAELIGHGAANKPRDYVINLLQDQKATLDGIFDFVKGERPLSTSYIKEMHAAMLRSQKTTEGVDSQGKQVEVPLIRGEWKTQPNSPVRDGVTYTYCPPEQVASEMERLIEIHAAHREQQVPVEVQAAWLHHRFTQIHPFQDGNGRIARAIASLVLIKDGLFPLVVTRDDRRDYIDSLEAADAGDLQPLVDLIAQLQIRWFRKASAITETLLVSGEGRQAAIDTLRKAAEGKGAAHDASLENVFELAGAIESDLEEQLEVLRLDVLNALQRIAPDAKVSVVRSDEESDYYYRAQIIRNAKEHIGYFADISDTSEYRSWVAMKMHWSNRNGHLVFAVHGIGKPFGGSLICAPFLEFRDRDEDNEARFTFTPITDEGFVFFHNEEREKLLLRFALWRENIFKLALQELARDL